jgi:two-component system sensor histidine kinase PilS (NtrC family)
VNTYFNLAGFLLAAVLSGYLSERTRLVRRELGKSKKSLIVLKNLNDNILKSLDSGVITLDLNGIIISANRKSKEILSIESDDELLNLDIYEFFPGLDLENLISTKREQILYTTKSGDKITLGFSSSLLKGDDDEMQGYILIFQDLTEIKILEDKLKNSEKLAILGQLASGLAHEIRNPLSAISGAIEILSSEVENSSDNRRLINVASQEIERMNLIVEDFSILTNPIPKTGLPVDISLILSETIDTFSKTIKRSDIDIERNIDSEIYVSGDSYRLKQSFWNLLLNSMQSITGEGLIKVEALSEKESVIIKISDTGCGISQKNISNIFDPFFTTKNSGTGLGLVIVQKVIESYNGKIDVVSAESEGSTFIITMEKESINAI